MPDAPPHTKPALTDDVVLLDPERRDLEPRAGQVGHTRMFARAKTINLDERTIDFVLSTADIDRYGEIVEPSAFRGSLPQFMRNPAFPFGHWYEASGDQTPTLGHWRDVRITEGALVGTAWFKPRGLGEQVWLDYVEGNLTSVSVAFLTRAWEMREVPIDGVQRRVRVFTEVDLLEVSAVLIPANPKARLRAAHYTPPAPGSSPAATVPGGDALADFGQRLKRLETWFDADRKGLLYPPPSDDAGAWYGRDGLSVDYLGDIPDADEPDPRSASTGDPQLHAALREVLAGRTA